MIKSFFSFALVALIFVSTLGLIVIKLENPTYLNEQLRRVNLYGRLTGNLTQLLPEDVAKDTPFTPDDVAEIITAAVPADTFYQFSDSFLTAELEWLTSKKGTLNWQYDLLVVRGRLKEKAVDRLLSKYHDLPVCTATQLRGWQAETGLPPCQLPEGNVRSNDLPLLFGQQVEKILEPVPAQLSITEPTAAMKEFRFQLTAVTRFIHIIWGMTVALILLFLLILRRRAFFALAVAFLFAGVLEAAFSLIAWDWVGKLVVDMLPEKAIGLPLIVNGVTALLAILKTVIGNISIALLITGGFFILLGLFFRVRPQPAGQLPLR